MPCIDAIDKKALTLKSDVRVEDALAKLKKAKTQVAVILDEEGRAAGLLSFKGLMQNLMPVSIDVGGRPLSLDAAPGVGKRLRKLYPLNVGEVMEHTLYAVAPSSRLIEAMRCCREFSAPAVVVENDDKDFLGLITESSVMERLGPAARV